MRAEQEHVTRQALGHELLVEGTDFQIGLGHEDVVEPVVRDRPAGGERQEPAAPARVQSVVHPVPQDARRRALDLGRQRLGEGADDRHELLAPEIAVGRRVLEPRVQGVDRQRLGGDGGDDLLGQDVERRFGRHDPVELTFLDRSHDGRRLQQLLASGHDDPALGRAAQQVPGAAHALQGRRDVARRLELDDQVDRADVDAELERGGGDQRAQLALLEAVLGLQPRAARERAVVRGHPAVGDAIVEVAREPLGRAPALREDERGAVRLDQLGDLLERRLPHHVALAGQEVVHRCHDLEVQISREAGVDRDRVPRGRPGEEGQRRLDRAHGRRTADALGPGAAARLDERLEALERERQVGASLGSHQRVNLVDDEEPRVGEGGPEPLAGQQDVQRLGRGDQDVRRPPGHRLSLRRERIAGAHGHAHLGQLDPLGSGRGADARQRRSQVLLDVVVERAERRDVDDVHAVLEASLEAEAVEVVERPQERRQGLARAGRGHDERVAPRGDRFPALDLRASRLGERVLEPTAHEREEVGHPDQILHVSAGPSGAGASGSACCSNPRAPRRSRNGRVSPWGRPDTAAFGCARWRPASRSAGDTRRPRGRRG